MIKFIIADGNDVSFFSSREEAESYCEAVDIEHGVYVGYDSEGRKIRFDTVGPENNVYKRRVRISLDEREPIDCKKLKKLLVGYLKFVKIDATNKNLRELLIACEHSWRKRN